MGRGALRMAVGAFQAPIPMGRRGSCCALGAVCRGVWGWGGRWVGAVGCRKGMPQPEAAVMGNGPGLSIPWEHHRRRFVSEAAAVGL